MAFSCDEFFRGIAVTLSLADATMKAQVETKQLYPWKKSKSNQRARALHCMTLGGASSRMYWLSLYLNRMARIPIFIRDEDLVQIWKGVIHLPLFNPPPPFEGWLPEGNRFPNLFDFCRHLSQFVSHHLAPTRSGELSKIVGAGDFVRRKKSTVSLFPHHFLSSFHITTTNCCWHSVTLQHLLILKH